MSDIFGVGMLMAVSFVWGTLVGVVVSAMIVCQRCFGEYSFWKHPKMISELIEKLKN